MTNGRTARPRGGYPLETAIFDLALPERRAVVQQCRALLLHGQPIESLGSATRLLWCDLMQMIADGKYRLEGLAEAAGFGPILLKLLSEAEPDFAKGALLTDDATFTDVRLVAPAKPMTPKGGNSRGPQPTQRSKVEEALRRDLESGELTEADLRGKSLPLELKYRASHATFLAAKKLVLSGLETSTKP